MDGSTHGVRPGPALGLAALAIAAALALSLPADAPALTRAQANAIALGALKPERHTFSIMVFGLPKPLEKGTDVVEGGAGPTARGHTKRIKHRFGTTLVTHLKRKPLRHRTWLFWEDLAPGAEFEHASTLLLVDDKSGKVVRRQPESWYPLVNGRRPAFLKSIKAYGSPRFRIYAHPTPNARPARARAGRAFRLPFPLAAARHPKLPNDCIITIGDRVDPMFKGDFELIAKVAKELDVPKADANSGAELEKEIQKAEKRKPPCKDILIAISAHGFPKKGSNIPNPDNPKENIPESEFAQVTLKTKVKNEKGEDTISQETFDSEQLRKILRRHKRTAFKLIVDSCFSGRWTELAGVLNLKVIATASRSDQASFGAASGLWTLKGSQTNGVVTYGFTPIINTTTNTTKASEFINGMFRALEKWANSDELQSKTGDDLAKGIAISFPFSKENDFTQQQGVTTPLLADYSGLNGPGAHADENLLPHAIFSFSPNNPPSSPKPGYAVLFNASQSYDADGTISEYEWDFGDGATGTGDYPSHVFAAPGKYRVVLKVTDDEGGSEIEEHNVFVSGPGNKAGSLNDIPCPDTVYPYTDVTVRIRIPSYAQNPSAAITSPPTCSGSSTSMLNWSLEQDNDLPADDPDGYDAWGNRKNTLVVTFRVSGGTAGGLGSSTVTASWQ